LDVIHFFEQLDPSVDGVDVIVISDSEDSDNCEKVS